MGTASAFKHMDYGAETTDRAFGLSLVKDHVTTTSASYLGLILAPDKINSNTYRRLGMFEYRIKEREGSPDLRGLESKHIRII